MTDVDITIADVRFEHLRDALGIGAAGPGCPGSSRPRRRLAAGRLRDRGLRAGWPAPRARPAGSSPTSRCWCPGRSRRWHRASAVRVRVRVWGADGQPSAWSAPAPVEAGLLARRRLERALRDARLGRGHQQAAAQPAAAPRVRRARGRDAGAAVRDRARRLRGRSSTARPSAITCWRPAGPATTTGCATRPST